MSVLLHVDNLGILVNLCSTNSFINVYFVFILYVNRV